MAATFQLEIVTPLEVIDCGQVEYLRASGRDGLFGVEARHTRMMAALNVGEVKVVSGGRNRYYAIGPGYADIQGQSVQLLVESAEESHSIDAARAKAASERARSRLKQKTDVDAARAESALARAVNRLNVAGRG
ncbi:MAG: ATP synthase F1 subunit epsilon [Candidatus Marinimicrobia bacterium]|nr:ATP synthase F1 subunit epsilon [Candidatus Neomarinimicrobiota bacterium]